MYNVFISHASEDKDEVARPLADLLISKGIKVWFDEYEIKLGDTFSTMIAEGLKRSDFGVVILSPDFFKKSWTGLELDILTNYEMIYSAKKILPVWHNIGIKEVMEYAPTLIGKKAAFTKDGLDKVAESIIELYPTKRSLFLDDYDMNKDRGLKTNWKAFNQERLFVNVDFVTENNKPVLLIRSTQKESVGANLFNLPSKGVVYFEYYIERMNLTDPNIVFYMIPIKKGKKLIEIGSNMTDDESSAYSFRRHRRRPMAKLNEWIREKIEYDFNSYEELDYVVFAPRINEGCPMSDYGQFKIRNVIVKSEQ